MKTQAYPENSALGYFLWIAIPLFVWSAICFILIFALNSLFSKNMSAGIGIAIGVTWFAICYLLICIGKRRFLPDQCKCPNCRSSLTLKDDGENTYHFYECGDCQVRWQLNIKRVHDD